MNLLLLAGNSQRNKEWIYRVQEVLSPLFQNSIVHDYAHWDGSGDYINLETELDALQPKVADWNEYIIFAKSVGSILALKGIYEAKLTPSKCLIAGLPLATILKERIPMDIWLQANTAPLLFVQNSHDPLGSAKEIREYMSQFNGKSHTVTELPGDTHSYEDLEKLKALIQPMTR